MEVFLTQLRAEEALWVSPHAQRCKPFRGTASLPLRLCPQRCASALAPRDYPRAPFPGPPDARSFLAESNREIVQGNTLPPTPAPPPSRQKPSAISFGSKSVRPGNYPRLLLLRATEFPSDLHAGFSLVEESGAPKASSHKEEK